MNCGLCAEYCPFDAIKMDHNFELSNYERHQTHIYSLQDVLVSSDFYAQTHPEAWNSAEEMATARNEASLACALATGPSAARHASSGASRRPLRVKAFITRLLLGVVNALAFEFLLTPASGDPKLT